MFSKNQFNVPHEGTQIDCTHLPAGSYRYLEFCPSTAFPQIILEELFPKIGSSYAVRYNGVVEEFRFCVCCKIRLTCLTHRSVGAMHRTQRLCRACFLSLVAQDKGNEYEQHVFTYAGL